MGPPVQHGGARPLHPGSRLPVYPFEEQWEHNWSWLRTVDLATRTYQRSRWVSEFGDVYPWRYCSDTSHQSPMVCTEVDGHTYCATRDPGPEVERGAGVGLRCAPVIGDYSRRGTSHPLAKGLLALKVPLVYTFHVPVETMDGVTRGHGVLTYDPFDNSIIGSTSVVLLGHVANADLPSGIWRRLLRREELVQQGVGRRRLLLYAGGLREEVHGLHARRHGGDRLGAAAPTRTGGMRASGGGHRICAVTPRCTSRLPTTRSAYAAFVSGPIRRPFVLWSASSGLSAYAFSSRCFGVSFQSST